MTLKMRVVFLGVCGLTLVVAGSLQLRSTLRSRRESASAMDAQLAPAASAGGWLWGGFFVALGSFALGLAIWGADVLNRPPVQY